MRLEHHGGRTVASAAHLALSQWARHLGASGTAAMQELPGLLAAVDQHAAEVRDAIADRTGRLHPVTLAAYADGVADGARARGWTPAERDTADWARGSWASVRLLAVCVLADVAGPAQVPPRS